MPNFHNYLHLAGSTTRNFDFYLLKNCRPLLTIALNVKCPLLLFEKLVLSCLLFDHFEGQSVNFQVLYVPMVLPFIDLKFSFISPFSPLFFNLIRFSIRCLKNQTSIFLLNGDLFCQNLAYYFHYFLNFFIQIWHYYCCTGCFNFN